MPLFRKARAAKARSVQSAPAETSRVEYVVRPCDDTWLIDHAGASYGPYKNGREAMLFAVDAARKLGAQGKNTGVKMIDSAGHLLTTWSYGAGRDPPAF
jgi:hypothetical protein